MRAFIVPKGNEDMAMALAEAIAELSKRLDGVEKCHDELGTYTDGEKEFTDSRFKNVWTNIVEIHKRLDALEAPKDEAKLLHDYTFINTIINERFSCTATSYDNAKEQYYKWLEVKPVKTDEPKRACATCANAYGDRKEFCPPSINKYCVGYSLWMSPYTPAQLEILNALYVLGWVKIKYLRDFENHYLTKDGMAYRPLYQLFPEGVDWFETLKSILPEDEFNVAKEVGK